MGRTRLQALHGMLERNVFTVIALGVCVTVHATLLRGDVAGDSWYTLLGGRTVVQSGLPHHDTWTVLTLGRQWVDQQWLGQLFFYGLWSAGGWGLALFVVLLLYLASFILAAALARSLGASDRAVAAIGVAAYFTGVGNTALRAQVPAYLLFALVLTLLIRDARGPSRWVIAVLPLLVLWANIHGSVLIGAALVSLRGLTTTVGGLRNRQPLRAWVLRGPGLLTLPWACTLLSPYGFGLIHYYRSTLGNGGLARASTEWGPTSVKTEPVFFALLLVAVWLVGRAGKTTTWFERLALAGIGLTGLYAVRYAVWFALAAAAILPCTLEEAWRGSSAPRRARLNSVLAGLAVAAGAIASVVVAAHGNGWFERDYPSRAADAVASPARADPALRVLADEKFADWLLFEHPELEGRIAYDVRFELLTSAQLSGLVGFRNELGFRWQRAADGYGLLVVDPHGDADTLAYYRNRRGTTVLFQSSAVVVLRRAL